jgi:hypothetical protein
MTPTHNDPPLLEPHILIHTFYAHVLAAQPHSMLMRTHTFHGSAERAEELTGTTQT